MLDQEHVHKSPVINVKEKKNEKEKQFMWTTRWLPELAISLILQITMWVSYLEFFLNIFE